MLSSPALPYGGTTGPFLFKEIADGGKHGPDARYLSPSVEVVERWESGSPGSTRTVSTGILARSWPRRVWDGCQETGRLCYAEVPPLQRWVKGPDYRSSLGAGARIHWHPSHPTLPFHIGIGALCLALDAEDQVGVTPHGGIVLRVATRRPDHA